MRRDHARRRCASTAVLTGVLAALGLATSVSGASSPNSQLAVVAWSTYLRAGPGETYAAIDELEHDTRVTIVACRERWCRVSGADGQGYVDQNALDLPRTRAPAPPARTDCVVVALKGDRRPIPTRFCSAPPGGD